jgi:hypothetical protein
MVCLLKIALNQKWKCEIMNIKFGVIVLATVLLSLFGTVNSFATDTAYDLGCVATVDIFNLKDKIRITHQQAYDFAPTKSLGNLAFRIVDKDGLVPNTDTQGDGHYVMNLPVNASAKYSVREILTMTGINLKDYNKYYLQILQLNNTASNTDFQAVYIARENPTPLIFTCDAPDTNNIR